LPDGGLLIVALFIGLVALLVFLTLRGRDS